jgi:hypothetical protein
VILGKDAAADRPADFIPYSYANPAFGSPLLVNTSLHFGDVGGTKGTSYGYDLNRDDDTDGRYIVQNWAYDQFIYFNNVMSNRFFTEAEFTVTASKAYPYNETAVDGFPKFGYIVTAPKSGPAAPNNPMVESTLFFYVDAVGFTQRNFGVRERMLDNSDWAWEGDNKLDGNAPSAAYTGGQYVKLGVLRDGARLVFFVNGAKLFEYTGFTGFDDETLSAVGFRCFSTELRIRNYTATADASVIDQKIAEIA